MDTNQALQVIRTVCAAHLCNRQDRLVIEQALNILGRACMPAEDAEVDKKED